MLSSVDKAQRFDVRAPRSWGSRFSGLVVFGVVLAFVAALPDLLKFLGSWKHAWKVLVPALLLCVSLHAQTKITPDCPLVVAARSTTGTSGVYDNRPQSGSTSPCTELIFTASATTTNSSFTIAVEGAQDNGAASCAGCSWSTLGSLTLSAEGTIKAPTGTYADYIRINLSAISGGTVSGVLTGWRPNQSTVAGGGGVGGMCPGGSATEIQVTDGTMCVGFADFVWNEVAAELGFGASGTVLAGFHALSSGESELNNGTPGSLAQLDLGIALIGSNDSAALAAFNSVAGDSVQAATIGGTLAEGILMYSPSTSGSGTANMYWATSGGTFSAPTNSSNGNAMGQLNGCYFEAAFQCLTLMDLIVDNPGTGAHHMDLYDSVKFSATTASQALATDSNGFVTSIAGFTGTCLALPTVSQGIITSC